MLERVQLHAKSHYDVIVCGHTLAAVVAVLACRSYKLKTCWLPDKQNLHTRPVVNNMGVFDSLAPEGVRYLSHVLDRKIIEDISLGHFEGIWRNNQFTQFDSIMGKGLHIDGLILKRRITSLLDSSTIDIFEGRISALSYDNCQPFIYMELGNKYGANWVIDGLGEKSKLAQNKINYLSDNLWISRNLIDKDVSQANTAKFLSDTRGWSWYAYDNSGRGCLTKWENNRDVSLGLYNSRWYCRNTCIENRLLLTVPTCFRFDPSCGLGISLQVKSALLAANVVRQCCRNIVQMDEVLITYKKNMWESFTEIWEALRVFYQEYDLWIEKSPLFNP